MGQRLSRNITNNSKGQKHVALLVRFVFGVMAGSVE